MKFAKLSPYIFILGTLIIGFCSPDYNHLSMTISRLSISRLGFLQTINFIQFALGLLITSEILTQDKFLKVTFRIAAISLILLSIFPTDPINEFPKQIFSLSPTAFIHFALIGTFIFLAPVCIILLTKKFKKTNLLLPTMALGWSVFFLSIIWIVFFYFGIFNNFRGLFQKIIFLEVIGWIILVMNRLKALARQNDSA
jgi:hypothetical protein